MKNKSNVRLKRSALTVALGMCFASTVAFGQSAVGSLFGEVKSGSTVVIKNPSSGFNREVTADSTGRFSVGQLAPGTYTVTSGGVSKTIVVKVGTGSKVNFTEDTTIDSVVVIGSGLSINPIDVSSVESTTVFTAEQIQKLPVSRDVTSVALLAPGTVRGDGSESAAFGNLASFGGASVAENGYYVNGFDVTNMKNMLSFVEIPFEAISQQQVKTGGYGAEFGRSLGGVVNIVTKSGTNEWKAGASIYWSPSWGREPGKDVANWDQDQVAAGDALYGYRSDNESSSTTYNIYAGGPLIEDKLFFFGIVTGRNIESDTYGQDSSSHYENKSPSALVKLDWNITDNQKLDFTAVYNKGTDYVNSYRNASGEYNTGQHDILTDDRPYEYGGLTYIARYTNYLTDTLSFTLLGGRSEIQEGYQQPDPSDTCVTAYNFGSGSTANYVGCWSGNFALISDPLAGPNKDTRTTYRLDFDWQLGDHSIRFGYDTQEYVSFNAGATFPGGIYWAHYFVPGSATIGAGNICGVAAGTPGRCVSANGQGYLVGANQNYARSRNYQSGTANYVVNNDAIYLEDSWQVTDNFLLYAGLRYEGFENLNYAGEEIVARNEYAPRFGFSWDVKGDSSLKVFGNAGRYYIPIASNTNIRAAGFETQEYCFFNTTGFDVNTGLPTGQGAQIGTCSYNGPSQAPPVQSVVASNLSPMYQDEYILGIQKALANNWTVGARAVYRKIGAGMDDYCGDEAFDRFATDNNITNFDSHDIGCVLINPGEDVEFLLPLTDGSFQSVSIPNDGYFDMPKYSRTYSAVELSFEKVSEKWSLAGSYTWSHSYGTAEGYVISTIGQADPGLSQEWDFTSFAKNTSGNLPNDRRHVIKAFGSYSLTDEWRLGANVLVSSGAPISCLGYPIPDGNDDAQESNYTAASSFFCASEDGSVVNAPRGTYGRTPWTWGVNASVAYSPSYAEGLTLTLDVFNLFNNDGILKYEETSAYKVGGAETYNPNYNNEQAYQTPRSLRLSARWDF